MPLNSREIAGLFWFGALAVFCLLKQDIRLAIIGILKMFAKPAIWAPFVGLLAYVTVFIWIARQQDVWNPGLVSGTVTWFIASAAVLLINIGDASKQPRFFRRVALRTLQLSVLIGFVMNLFVLSLPAELVLQPLIAILAGVSIVAAHRQEDQAAKRLADALLALLTLAIAVFVVVETLRNWGVVSTKQTLLAFALPIWLTVAILPFIYVISIYASYQVTFARLRFHTDDEKSLKRADWALVWVLRGRTRDVTSFGDHWLGDVSAAPTFRTACSVVKSYKHERRSKEREKRRRLAELRCDPRTGRMDAEGRQMDRREFDETTMALDWLATCQMGRYDELGGYRADMLELLDNDFKDQGLPHEHGIQMLVTDDLESWWAWRRTVTGWCFAIGSNAPPPDQWLFDGPNPPTGPPGGDPIWGSSPDASLAMNW